MQAVNRPDLGFKVLHTALILFFMLILTLKGIAGDDSLRRKAEKIHQNSVNIDSHTDTPLNLMRGFYDLSVWHDARKDYSKVDFPRMKAGGLDGVFFAAFVSQGPRNPEANEKAYRKGMVLFDSIDAELKRNSEKAALAVTPMDIVNHKKCGKSSVLIGIENGYMIGRDLSLISTFYLRGARYITLCHTRNNDICDSSTDSTEHHGLSPYGYEVIREMEHVGMMIDVSHISDKALLDVLGAVKVPIIASHSCAKALCNNPRNLSDSLLKAIARNGGVVQMCLLSDYVRTPASNPVRDSVRKALRIKFHDFEGLSDQEMKIARAEWIEANRKYPPVLANVQDVVDHIDHIVKVAGINHVGIGSDFDGGGGIDGCFDVSEMGNITLELVRRGYSERKIRKIWGGNLMRVMNEVHKSAQEYQRTCNCT